ncbi:LacI family DNA-binding transcriptional regulator [Pseudomonas savastanoi]|uniref:LacI family DNA-binding transcriptional regulator n=1 Tax=Pseudomonas savastanoi TaxID=29438 RepID=UPI000BA43F23|nr:LacI family DNA-binding transcriptional regulator [Pseudomonas savastanoi]PAB28692.1 hypothetical protein CC202_17785 [Pseudomonas savastanoi]RMU44835.1 LacI family transcriptional regulator [Pseudomonas savastanoi pv. nerii]
MTDEPASLTRGSRPTIRDVARVAKVSIGTVSAVINKGGTSVAPHTREHVLRCITELGFEPNNAARSLKRQRISSIGFIVPDLKNSFFADVAEGIQSALDNVDFLLVLCMTWASKEREEYYAQVLRTQRLDGVIYLSGTGMPCAPLLNLAKHGTVIFVDECLPGLEVPFISSQNLKGARSLARHVIESGHTRLAILSGPRGLWTSEQRQAGYREACAGAGIDPDEVQVIEGDYTEQSGENAAEQVLAMDINERPSAVLCANDLMAIGFIRRCNERGLRVPADISVTGFDDIAGAERLDPPLTTVKQPGRAMGQAAAQLLLNRIGAGTEPPAQLDFPTQLCIRSSVAKL